MPSARARLHALALAVLEQSKGHVPARDLALHARLAQAGQAGSVRLRRLERRYQRRAAREAEQLNQPLEAAACYTRLCEISGANTRQSIEALMGLARSLRHGGQLDAARKAARRARGLARRLGRPADCAQAELLLGELDYLSSRLAQARRHARLGQKLARAARSTELEGVAVNMIGVVTFQMGQPRRGLRMLEQAERVLQRGRDKYRTMLSRVNRAVVLNDLGELQRARAILEGCVRMARSRGDARDLGTALGNLGITFRKLGRMAQARRCYQEALGISREVGALDRISANLGNLANLDFSERNFEQGARLMQEAMMIAEELGDLSSLGLFSVNLASYHIELGEYGRALRLVLDGLALAQRAKIPYYEASALNTLACLYNLTGEFSRAAACAQDAARTLEGIGMGDTAEFCSAQGHRAVALACMGRHKEARATARRGLARKTGYRAMAEDPDADTSELSRNLKSIARSGRLPDRKVQSEPTPRLP
ncbi:hypothetical protein EDM80_00740 [bacterium]|nr:MAG: hypothetical protein EDM80_00740 [bacterium]RIK64985.1 MAG: hypothetical protein DCC64_02635 [Planctomycetota bacterium]